eukprot:PhM_4_TR18076/c5_g4_i1/m.44708
MGESSSSSDDVVVSSMSTIKMFWFEPNALWCRVGGCGTLRRHDTDASSVRWAGAAALDKDKGGGCGAVGRMEPESSDRIAGPEVMRDVYPVGVVKLPRPRGVTAGDTEESDPTGLACALLDDATRRNDGRVLLLLPSLAGGGGGGGCGTRSFASAKDTDEHDDNDIEFIKPPPPPPPPRGLGLWPPRMTLPLDITVPVVPLELPPLVLFCVVEDEENDVADGATLRNDVMDDDGWNSIDAGPPHVTPHAFSCRRRRRDFSRSSVSRSFGKALAPRACDADATVGRLATPPLFVVHLLLLLLLFSVEFFFFFCLLFTLLHSFSFSPSSSLFALTKPKIASSRFRHDGEKSENMGTSLSVSSSSLSRKSA